jgi:glycosyltransferase involved in cell wall biosynthesis
MPLDQVENIEMLSFSLITATVGRTEELENLLDSLASQAYPELECIIVDQNLDRRVKDIVDSWKRSLNIRTVDSVPGLSRSRNVGLALAKGDILAFPDDDCWYSPRLLANVSSWFEQHAEYGFLTVGAEDLNGVSSGNRWIQDHCEIRPSNAFRTTFSSTIFVRRTAAAKDNLFDEAIGAGAGTRFGSGEETDYILGLMATGARGYFDRTWNIGHPKRDMLSGQVNKLRAFSYGSGMGYVLRKRSQNLLAASFVAYDLLRSLGVLIRGDLRAAHLCCCHAQGIADGYFGGQP